jgi:hypothetical protein
MTRFHVLIVSVAVVSILMLTRTAVTSAATPAPVVFLCPATLEVTLTSRTKGAPEGAYFETSVAAVPMGIVNVKLQSFTTAVPPACIYQGASQTAVRDEIQFRSIPASWKCAGNMDALGGATLTCQAP